MRVSPQLQAQLPPGEKPVFADIGVNNFMSGRDTLFAHVVNAGGWRTLGETLGYTGFTNIPLEQLLRSEACPDLHRDALVEPALDVDAKTFATPSCAR